MSSVLRRVRDRLGALMQRRIGLLLSLCLMVGILTPFAAADSGAATGIEVGIGDASVHEGDSGTARTLQFAVSLSRASTTTTVTARVTIAGVTATAGSDFTGTLTRTVTFKPLQVTKYVSITVRPDVDALGPESDETIAVTLSSPTGGAVLGRATAIGTIVNDDVASGARLAIGDAGIVEGDSGSHVVKAWITLANPTGATVSVRATTANGTAVAGSDYVTLAKTITFPAGTVKRVVAVRVLPDVADHPDLDFSIVLSNVAGATVVDGSSTIRVYDDDAATSGGTGIETPGSTDSIQLVSSTQMSGYQVEYYRNTAYPCSISGYQTFAIGYPIGLATTTPRPLWTYLHPGGIGWFDTSGQAVPDETYLREESLNALVFPYGLNERVLGDPAGFRMLFVSYCNRDLYGGGQVDPNNPNLITGQPRTTNGLWATKAAIQFSLNRFATTKYFLHGGSAGSGGGPWVAWALQRQGIPPAGIVADSYVVNQDYVRQIEAQSIECPSTGVPMTAATVASLSARLHPELADPNNEPDRLVGSGRLTVPLLHIWNHADPFGCDGRTMQCPLRDGTSVAMGGMDCMNEPLRRVIAAQGTSSRNLSLAVCVPNLAILVRPCNQHVVTSYNGVNSDPGVPADYNGRILTWVHNRLADP